MLETIFSICSVLAIFFPLISLCCTLCSELKLFGKSMLEICLQPIRGPLHFRQLQNAEGKSVS